MYVAGAEYDAAGRLTQLPLKGGALQTAYYYFDWTTPNGQGRLAAIHSGTPGSPQLLQDLYYGTGTPGSATPGYDAAGNILRIEDRVAGNPQVCTYGYDALDRLTHVNGEERYSYNAIGNLLRKVESDLGWDLTLTYTDTAHVHAPGVVGDSALGFGYNLRYDENGNLIQAQSFSLSRDRFDWDNENRLVRRTTQWLVMQHNHCPEVYDPERPCPPWILVWQTTGWDAYTRDADGRVVARNAANGEHLYIGDHYELHNGLATSYYPFGGRRVALREGTAVSYLFADHLGSTRVMDTGTDTPAQQYTPWGEIVESWTNTLPTEYTYTGQREASATGGLRLLDYGARHYAPWLGRFISPDSIVPEPGNPQSLNRYAYVLNNPLRFVDPGRLEPIDVAWEQKLYRVHGRAPTDQDRRDRFFSILFAGSGPNGSWTDADWAWYSANRQEFWSGSKTWPGAPATGLDRFVAHLLRLASYYVPGEEKLYAQAIGFIWGGVPPGHAIPAAWQMATNPGAAWAQLAVDDTPQSACISASVPVCRAQPQSG